MKSLAKSLIVYDPLRGKHLRMLLAVIILGISGQLTTFTKKLFFFNDDSDCKMQKKITAIFYGTKKMVDRRENLPKLIKK